MTEDLEIRIKAILENGNVLRNLTKDINETGDALLKAKNATTVNATEVKKLEQEYKTLTATKQKFRNELNATSGATQRSSESFLNLAKNATVVTAGLIEATKGIKDFFSEYVNLGAKVKTIESNFKGTKEQLEKLKLAGGGIIDDSDIMKLSNYSSTLKISYDDQAKFLSIARLAIQRTGGDASELDSVYKTLIKSSEGMIKGLTMAGISKTKYNEILKEEVKILGGTIEEEKDENGEIQLSIKSLPAAVQQRLRLSAAIKTAEFAYGDLTKIQQTENEKLQIAKVNIQELKEEMAKTVSGAIMPFIVGLNNTNNTLRSAILLFGGLLTKVVELAPALFVAGKAMGAFSTAVGISTTAATGYFALFIAQIASVTYMITSLIDLVKDFDKTWRESWANRNIWSKLGITNLSKDDQKKQNENDAAEKKKLAETVDTHTGNFSNTADELHIINEQKKAEEEQRKAEEKARKTKSSSHKDTIKELTELEKITKEMSNLEIKQGNPLDINQLTFYTAKLKILLGTLSEETDDWYDVKKAINDTTKAIDEQNKKLAERSKHIANILIKNQETKNKEASDAFLTGATEGAGATKQTLEDEKTAQEEHAKKVQSVYQNSLDIVGQINNILGLGADSFVGKMLSGLQSVVGLANSVVSLLGNFMSIGSGGIFGLLGFAEGGYVSGNGTATSDSIPAWLSNGEYVINSRSTSQYLPLLHAINNNSNLPNVGKYATGGMVNRNYNNISSNTYINFDGKKFYQVQETEARKLKNWLKI